MGKTTEFRFDSRSVREILASVGGPGALVVVDGYHAGLVPPDVPRVVVTDNTREAIRAVREGRAFDRVIGVGTCTALDFAKAVATERAPVTILPIVLSTACISIDKSVIREDGKSAAVLTVAPDRTIVPILEIMNAPADLRRRTGASGFGDILARFGAAADVAYRRGTSLAEVLREMPDATAVLEWILAEFSGFDEACMRALARFSHDASTVTIANRERGKAELNVGSEHALYYWMVDHFPLYRSTRYIGLVGKWRYRWDTALGNRRIPTHGEIVAVGTLVALGIEAERSGDDAVYLRMRDAFARLGLPTRRSELRDVHIRLADLERAMRGIRAPTRIYEPALAGDASALLARVFP